METAQTYSGMTIRGITRRYYVVHFFDAIGPSFIFAIYPLFLHARGLNQFQMNCVAATYFVVTFLTDVPTGAFADAVGRRISYVMGCALSAGAFVLYFFAMHYWTFLMAETIDAVGGTLRNGAIDAWAVDALDDAGLPGTKDRIFSRVSQLLRFGAMFGALSGAYAARIDIAIPWLLGAGAQVVMGVVAVFLMRGEKPRSAHLTLDTVAAQVRDRMIKGLRDGFGTRVILILAIANAVVVAAWVPYQFEWPLFFNSGFNRGPQVVGWIFCLFAVAGIMGSELVARWQPEVPGRWRFLGIGVLAQSGCLLFAGLLNASTQLVMWLFACANLAAGAMGPVYMSWYNDEIEETHRATMLSFQTACTTFGSAVGLPGGGRLADRFGLAVAWQFGGVLSMLAAPFYLSLRPRAAVSAVPNEAD